MTSINKIKLMLAFSCQYKSRKNTAVQTYVYPALKDCRDIFFIEEKK